jgi:hypothetical protein
MSTHEPPLLEGHVHQGNDRAIVVREGLCSDVESAIYVSQKCSTTFSSEVFSPPHGLIPERYGGGGVSHQ